MRTSKRIVVAGGLGFFGSAAVAALRAAGESPLVASRRTGAELLLDVEDRDSIRAVLKAGDVVLDAAGPFHERSITLAEAAIEMGLDLIDLSESLDYARSILHLAPAADRAGIRLLTSCSSVSAITAATIRASGIDRPVRVRTFLAPATRDTASHATAGAVLKSLGRPIRTFRNHRLQSAMGWRESRLFELPPPFGSRRGFLVESADACLIPQVWSSIESVELFVDGNTPGVNSLLTLAAYLPVIRSLMNRLEPAAIALAHRFGSRVGCYAVEVESESGGGSQGAFLSPERSWFIAVAPAVLAAIAIARERFEPRGLVLPDRHVESQELFGYLRRNGIEVSLSRL